MTSLEFQSPSDSLTPLMRQYNAIKAQNPDTVLLYRMGDFYEMFNEDAKIASKVLGLTLTARNHGGAEDVPLAGFPHHAIDRYANRLVKAGYKIAICEQTEDPKNAKGVVKRDIVEIITAGTATEDNFIEEKSNNFIVAVVAAADALGIAICDLSTGLFEAEEIPKDMLGEELVRIDPAEVLLAGEEDNPLCADVKNALPQALVSRYDAWKFEHDIADKYLCGHFGVATLSGFGFATLDAAACAAGGLLSYLKEQKKNDLRHIVALSPRALSSFADLDPSTIRNLELLRPMHADDEDGTLLWVLDKTSTAMGGRLLRTWITHPLKDLAAITGGSTAWPGSRPTCLSGGSGAVPSADRGHRTAHRPGHVRAGQRPRRGRARPVAGGVSRIVQALSARRPRIVSRQRDVARRVRTTRRIGVLKTIVEARRCRSGRAGSSRPGVSAELDEIRSAIVNGKKWIASLQESERSATRHLVAAASGTTSVFGYYIEVSKANLGSVPGELHPQADACQRRTVHHARAQGHGGQDPGRRRKVRGAGIRLFVALRSSHRGAMRPQSRRRRAQSPCSTCSVACTGRDGKRLLQARARGISRSYHTRRPAPGGGTHDAAPATSSFPTTPTAARRLADIAHHRPQHGGKIDLSAAERAYRAHGADGFVRARCLGADRRC